MTRIDGRPDKETGKSGVAQKIMDYLRTLPCSTAWRNPVDEIGKRGMPDIMLCLYGQLFVFEAKALGNQPTPVQAIRMSEFETARAIVAVVRSVDDVRDVVVPWLATHATEPVSDLT